MEFEEFEKIQEEIAKDLKFDNITIGEIVMRVPSIKHYWVAYLIRKKIEQRNLKKKKEETIQMVRAYVQQNVGLSQKTALAQLNNHPEVIAINEKLEELEIIIDYLERVERIFSTTSYDFKNAIDMMKMETL